METKKSNNQAATKVICQNCGAEVIIPAHESVVTGVTIGKDSGLGTVILPTVGGSSPNGLSDLKLSNGSAASKLAEIRKSNPELAELVMALVTDIQDSSYLSVEGLDWRWIPAQALGMVYSRQGFHSSLMDRSYMYSWEVLMADLKRQCKMFEKGDVDGFNDKIRFYNKKVALAMANHYLKALSDYIPTMKRHWHKGRPYVKLLVSWMNHGRGVHLGEIDFFLQGLRDMISGIERAKSANDVQWAAQKFYTSIRGIKWHPESMAPEFVNVYKAVGAYYTMKDLIMFEGKKMKVDHNGEPVKVQNWCNDHRRFIEKEESLAALEKKTNSIISYGIGEYGYMMLGMLKDFLGYNKFDFKATVKSWAEQSEARKAMRKSGRGNRRQR